MKLFFFDLETTGTNPSRHGKFQIGNRRQGFGNRSI